MSWSPILPVRTQAKTAAVAVGCFAPGKRRSHGLRLILRADAMAGVTFLGAGSRVDVLRGAGEHAGMLRIVPGTGFGLICPRPDKTRTVIVKGVPLPAGIDANDRPAVPVDFDYGAEWVEIMMPDWARASSTPARLESTKTARTPFSISDRIADPVTALRGTR